MSERNRRRPKLVYSTSRWKHRRCQTKAIINMKISSGRKIYCFVLGPSKLLLVLARGENLKFKSRALWSFRSVVNNNSGKQYLWSKFWVVKSKIFASNSQLEIIVVKLAQLKILHKNSFSRRTSNNKKKFLSWRCKSFENSAVGKESVQGSQKVFVLKYDVKSY